MALDLSSLSQVVVLVRHGDALSKAEDPARPLSEAGRRHAEWAAAWLAALQPGIDEVRHSGKLRARQTAQIIAARLPIPDEAVREVAGLNPNDDVVPVAIELEAGRRRVVLAGHLPFMGRLASQLLVGDSRRLGARFADAAVMVLAVIDGTWQLIAFTSHETDPAAVAMSE